MQEGTPPRPSPAARGAAPLLASTLIYRPSIAGPSATAHSPSSSITLVTTPGFIPRGRQHPQPALPEGSQVAHVSGSPGLLPAAAVSPPSGMPPRAPSHMLLLDGADYTPQEWVIDISATHLAPGPQPVQPPQPSSSPTPSRPQAAPPPGPPPPTGPVPGPGLRGGGSAAQGGGGLALLSAAAPRGRQPPSSPDPAAASASRADPPLSQMGGGGDRQQPAPPSPSLTPPPQAQPLTPPRASPFALVAASGPDASPGRMARLRVPPAAAQPLHPHRLAAPAPQQRAQQWLDQGRDVLSLLLFYAALGADAAALAELSQCGCSAAVWGPGLALLLWHLPAIALLLLLHNGWLAVCRRYLLTLIRTEGSSLRQAWPHLYLLRYPLIAALVALMVWPLPGLGSWPGP